MTKESLTAANTNLTEAQGEIEDLQESASRSFIIWLVIAVGALAAGTAAGRLLLAGRAAKSQHSELQSQISRNADSNLESSPLQSLFGLHGVVFRFLESRRQKSGWAGKLLRSKGDQFVPALLESIEGMKAK